MVRAHGLPSRSSERRLVHPAGLPPANSPFEAEDDNNFTTDAEMEPMERAFARGHLHSRGALRRAVYETAAVAAEPHRRNGGSPRCCPVLCGLRDRCIAAMLATRTPRVGGVEPPQSGL